MDAPGDHYGAQVRLDEPLQRSMYPAGEVPAARVVHHVDAEEDIEAAKVVAQEDHEGNVIFSGEPGTGACAHSERSDTAHVRFPSFDSNSLVVGQDLSWSSMFTVTLLLGWSGAHQFALGRFKWGFLYVATLGFLGWGIIVDLLSLRTLLDSRCKHLRLDGHNDLLVERQNMAQRAHDSYVLWIFGMLGLHQFYLGRTRVGLLYLCSFGLFGMYIFDLVHIPALSRANADELHVFEAYLTLIPGGFFGLHHFYLGNWKLGLLYLCTLGLLGFGFLIDLVRLPSLVQKANKEREAEDAQDARDHQHDITRA
ncbi:TM2 domain-containing protein DDB_G0287015 [Hondaea fermentalgiana]|uniref:TM2 domain-containing protein DDB_G0287015 n=1 Tax=Hondaea fermentalgiana TaxID=2315210 RepID=A0A2R5G1T4_9STRA|nr:TM2 domain-containing protein DDB_G0287015 [Hondaea fermentalgiana]|eukprot:GBG24952.1 TM2 domain-containing protein DDB_G0287015 [Hondaea fermentalgiana]